MYARVVTAQLQPGKINEGASAYRDAVVPGSKVQPGFKGGLLLTDPSTGKAIGLTMWETEADLSASESNNAFRDAMAAFAQALAGPPAREHYEVSVQV